ncbi:MAG: polymer-forming cytoskeletal protein [Acidobacteriota bacterium]
MKFFDPKKKESPAPNNPASTQRPSNLQNPNPAPVSNPQPQPSSAPAQPFATAPQQQHPKVEAVKPEPVKMEPPKQDPLKPEPPKQQPVAAAPTISMPASELSKPVSGTTKQTGKTLIGNSVTIRGDITSDENLQIEGVVDGSIEANNDVVVGHEGRVNATIRAVNIVIQGRVIGDVTASNRVELAPSALLQGNIRSPKLSIAETAKFKGSVDMRPKEASPAKDQKEKDKEKNVAASTPLETVEK